MSPDTAPPAPLSAARRRLVIACALGVVLFSAWRFDGPARGYWDTYITVPAMFMTGQPVELTRIDGTPRFTYSLKGRVPDDTYDPAPGSFGIASEDQRIGTGILFAAPFALFRMAAFRWGFAATWGVMFAFAFLMLRRLQAGFWIPLGGALLLVFNPFSLYLERLNGNLFGLAILVVLFFLATEPRPRWWLLGLLYGLLGGIRNEAIVLAPMFLALQWRAEPRPWPFARSLASFGAFALVAILPVLFWNQFAYGQMLIHPSQVAHLEGFRPTFVHQAFGQSFDFNGLLNWPFHTHVVRTPHFAFPTFLTWPLVTLKSLGLPLAALAPIGVIVLIRRRRLEGALLLFWYGIVFALFMFQENWEELKQTFMALHLFPLVAFVAAGVAWLVEGVRSWRRWAVLGAVMAVLALGVLRARALDVPVDERWYVRFPHAARNESGLATLPPELRKDWQYFYTRETPDEIVAEREHLTRLALYPSWYRPVTWPDATVWRRMADEPFTSDLRTLAVWSYIYE